MSENDVLNRVAGFRPDDAQLGAEWTAADQDRTLAAILDVSRPPAGRVRWLSRRRVVAAGAVAAAVAAAVVAASVLPAGSPGGPSKAEAATLRHLAGIAGRHGAIIKPGQYVYVDETDWTYAPVPLSSHQQIWTAASGESWIYRNFVKPTACLEHYPAPKTNELLRGQYEGQSATALATLPTRADSLAAFIAAHPDGDNRGDDNLWEAVYELLGNGGGLASPQLRAAAIEVLARIDNVSVRTGRHDSAGRPATEVTRKDKYGYETLLFDPRTSALLEGSFAAQGNQSGRALVRKMANVDHMPTNLPRC